ncbi:MAG: hypothetical protein IPI91_15340 [Flavobacteriales bacterium]|nr:hypothetical protein [Flavobacteriales bacterium]
MITTRIIIGVVVAAFAQSLHAQKHRIEFVPDIELPSKWWQPVQLPTAAGTQQAKVEQINFLLSKGYLEATIDTCITTGDTTVCPIAVGWNYRWAQLSGSGIPVEIASAAKFRDKLYSGRPITPRQVARLFEGLMKQSENNGYPFVNVRFDSLNFSDDGLMARVVLDKGRLVKFDSVLVRGSAKTNIRYLHSYIGIRPGDLYNEAVVASVERRLKELPFIVQKQRPYVQFTQESTKLYLFLDTKKASSINGVLGLQPDPLTGKTTLTGDIDLRLRNALKRGEAIELNWRSLVNSTQDLKTHFNLPFAFNTPFGVDLGLKLFKRDTTFLEVTARGGLDYILPRGDKLSVFINSKSSDRLGRNTVQVPGLADVSTISYGLGLERERFDYRFNPKRGHSAKIEGSAGKKRTTTAVFGQQEQPPEIRTVQYQLDGTAVAHIPIKRRSTIRLAGQGGWMVNDDLYTNELYRIGGLKTLRGANEAFIVASSYAIATLEYRFVFEENSNFFAFFDQGWWENSSQNDFVTDTPFGFGVGTMFETKAGLFSLTYALGKQFNNPIELRTGKVHFGFISLF